MKKIFYPALLSFVAGIQMFISCDKNENDTPPVPESANMAPVANAGPDIIIGHTSCASLRPIYLDGSRSFDPDNDKIKFQWTHLSGSPITILTYDHNDDTAIFNNVALRNAFELKVTDSKGVSSRDTVIVDATNWVLQELDFDITINGKFDFWDNQGGCDDFCYYSDVVRMTGTGNFSPIGELYLEGHEATDSAASNTGPLTLFIRSVGTRYASPYYMQGDAYVSFKQVIQNGGGAFAGTLNITNGSAEPCILQPYRNLAPLTITGSIDTTGHTISMTIKGKTFF